MTALLLFLLTYFLHSTIWILLTALLVKVPFLQGAACRHFLWKMALIGGLSSSLSASFLGSGGQPFPLMKEVSETQHERITVPSKAEIKLHVVDESLVTVDEAEAGPNDTMEGEPTFNGHSDREGRGDDLAKWLLITWLAGVLLLFLKIYFQHRRYLRKIGPREAVDQPWAFQALRDIRRQTHLRDPITLSQSPNVQGPLLIRGLEICLPGWVLREMNRTHLPGMLAHEMAHIARKDYYWRLGMTILETLFFFQPLHRWPRREIESTTEILCDAWAAEATGDNIGIAECLLQVAGWMKAPGTSYPLVVGMALKKSNLTQRITALLNTPDMKKERFYWWRASLPLALLSLLSFLAIPSIILHSAGEQIPPVVTELADVMAASNQLAAPEASAVAPEVLQQNTLTEVLPADLTESGDEAPVAPVASKTVDWVALPQRLTGEVREIFAESTIVMNPIPMVRRNDRTRRKGKYEMSVTAITGRIPGEVQISNVSVVPARNRLVTDFKLRKPAEVKIQVWDAKENLIETIADRHFNRGGFGFFWDYSGLRSGHYQLRRSFNGVTSVHHLLLRNGKERGNAGNDSCAALLRAVKANQLKLVRDLLNKVDPNCEYRADGEPRTPLNAAARLGNVEIGKLLLGAGAKVEWRATGDEGALMGAARYGHLEFVRLLLENGAGINRQVDGDGTALINAVRGGHYEVAEYLLEQGADPLQNSPGDENPLYHAISQGDKMLDLVLKYRKRDQ